MTHLTVWKKLSNRRIQWQQSSFLTNFFGAKFWVEKEFCTDQIYLTLIEYNALWVLDMLQWCGEKERHWLIRGFQTWFYLYLSGGDFCLSSNLPSNRFDFQHVAPPPCCAAALFWEPFPSSTLLIPPFLLTDFADFPSSRLGCDAFKQTSAQNQNSKKTWWWANKFDKT